VSTTWHRTPTFARARRVGPAKPTERTAAVLVAPTLREVNPPAVRAAAEVAATARYGRQMAVTGDLQD